MEISKPLGFWSVWALAAGVMIGSGVFLLPVALAPYGLLSFGGWILGGVGAIAIVLCFCRLAARATRDGGPYRYVRDAFGDLAGFLMGWGYWLSFWNAIAVVAIAFVGYLGFFFPSLTHSTSAQGFAALALIWTLTIVNILGLREMSVAQISMTVLKIIPLIAIAAVAFAFGAPANLPAFNPTNAPILPSLAAVTLITLWPFSGFESAVTCAESVQDCRRTIPRALVAAILMVTVIYLTSTLGVMLLIPAEQLAHSEAPFADAARALGPWGASFVAAGALIATAGSLNGLIFTTGQIPKAISEDAVAPGWMGRLNKGGSPYLSLILGSSLGSIQLLLNYSRGLVAAFTFLLMMTTSITLIYYLACALAELKHSWRSAKGWAALALLACGYCLFALLGSGIEIMLWGGVLMLAGVPVYFLLRRNAAGARQDAHSLG